MKSAIVGLAALLAGCCTPPPEPEACPSVPDIEATRPAPPPPPVALEPPSVATVAAAYQLAAEKAITAVTSADATPDYVRAVHAADHAARQAVRALEHEGKQPHRATLASARGAVKALSDVVEQPPGD